MLKMKQSCERCGEPLRLTDRAYICSFECTYCPSCAEQQGSTCLNCQGQLTLRPPRKSSPTEAPSPRFKAKLEKILS